MLHKNEVICGFLGESAGERWQDGFRDIERLILQQMTLWAN